MDEAATTVVVDTSTPRALALAHARAARAAGHRVAVVVRPSTIDVAAAIADLVDADLLVGPDALTDHSPDAATAGPATGSDDAIPADAAAVPDGPSDADGEVDGAAESDAEATSAETTGAEVDGSGTSPGATAAVDGVDAADDGGVVDGAGASATAGRRRVAGTRPEDALLARLHGDDGLDQRLAAALAELPDDTHGPDRPLPGFVLALRLEGLAPAPRGVGVLLVRRVHALWQARLAAEDLLLRVDDDLALAVVRGDQLRVDELTSGWQADAAAFSPTGRPLEVRVGADAPEGTDPLTLSAARAVAAADALGLAAGDDDLPADLRAVLALVAGRRAARAGQAVDVGVIAATTATTLASSAGLDAVATARVTAAARWHLLPEALLAAHLGTDVTTLVAGGGAPEEAAVLAAARREATRRVAPRRAA